MKVIMTGHLGFVGYWTGKLFDEYDVDWVGYDLIEGNDITDRYTLKQVIGQGDKILHLAAVSRFDQADRDPQRAYSVNVGGTANIIQIAKENKADRIVHASTGSVYMPVMEAPITEEHRIIGNSHYGLSKRMAEEMYSLSEIPYVILRYGHIFGKLKGMRGLVGAFTNRIARGLKPTLYGGKQTNSFVYVKDIAWANLIALKTPKVNDTYNIAGLDERSTEECFKIMKDATGYEGEIEYLPMRNVDDKRFFMDISKAQERLGYTPNWNFETGIGDMFK